jgi:hypothetical protein
MRPTCVLRCLVLLLLLVVVGCSHPEATPPPHRATAGITPCPQGTLLGGGQAQMVDYVDFLVFRGHQYLAGGLGGSPVPVPRRLGAVVGHVRCSLLNAPTNRGVPPQPDGTAAFLPVGTPLYAVPGLPVGCELAARREGQVVAYVLQVERNHVAGTSDCWRGQH